MHTNRKDLLESMAATISDYREGDVPRPTPARIDRWISQFPDNVQEPLLRELNHVFRKTYISRDAFDVFLRGLATNKKFTDGEPGRFWHSAHLLDVQKGGMSQRELLVLFRKVIGDEFGADANGDGPFIYIDDGVFSGTRVICDLGDWIRKSAPAQGEVRIVVAALYTGGQYHASTELKKVIQETGKKIRLGWWHCLMPENRKTYRNTSDVLWPTALPEDPDVKAYAEYLKRENYPVVRRQSQSVGTCKFFSSHAGRLLLEEQLLIAGARIRRQCTNMQDVLRPLGFMGLRTLGFGSMIVTFRNCPNTCPLPFWASDPWVPLFPRSTNSDASTKRLVAAIGKWKSRKA